MSTVLLGGFGLALARGENVSPPQLGGSREELCDRMQMAECTRPPENVGAFLRVSSDLVASRVVAVVTVGQIVREDPEIRALQDKATPPPPRATPKSAPSAPTSSGGTDYALRIDEVLSGTTVAAGDSVTWRLSGTPDAKQLTETHPREGDRLLVVLLPHPRDAALGVFRSYDYKIANISGPKAHFTDVWRTSVKEMGAPERTPAFIEAVRAALAAP